MKNWNTIKQADRFLNIQIEIEPTADERSPDDIHNTHSILNAFRIEMRRHIKYLLIYHAGKLEIYWFTIEESISIFRINLKIIYRFRLKSHLT